MFKRKSKIQSKKLVLNWKNQSNAHYLFYSSVNAKDMEQAIRAVNPHIRHNELVHIVQWIFEAKDGSQVPSMNVHDVLQRLQNGVFYRQHTLSS